MSFKRKIIARLNRSSFLDNHVYTAKRGPALGLRRQGGMGWLPSFLPLPRMHEEEEEFLAGLDWSGLTVFDVGGDQGLFTLFFAHRVGEHGQVVVFEPNSQSSKRIEQNVRHNKFTNVRIMSVGLGAKRETLQFTFPETEPARGTAIPTIAEQIEREANPIACEIQVNALDDEIKLSGLPIPHFIKIDVEGMEYPALMGMQATLTAHRPRLSIEMHGADMKEKAANAERVVALLDKAGYQMQHTETGKEINRTNATNASRGHLYCKPNTAEQ